MVPEGNQIVESVYEAKKIICPLGIEIEKIHACKNSCVLFHGDYADLDKCPKCGYVGYKRKNDGGDDNNADDENDLGEIRGKKKANRGATVRVAWYFCIIPQLRRWFATQKEAQLLLWQEEGRKDPNYKKDGKFRHPADAAQWGNINTHFPWFDGTSSIRFAMSIDGVNPFGNQSSTHSDRIDVYLRPLVDDLKILWKPGVPKVWDEYKREEFTMHGLLFNTINDNPAHRSLSGQSKWEGATFPHYLKILAECG
jgi:hypothetical protein